MAAVAELGAKVLQSKKARAAPPPVARAFIARKGGMRSDERGRRDEPVIEVSTEGDAVVVRLEGELDIHTTRSIRGVLLDAANGATGRRVVVDLSQVEFMDSTALATLLEARGRLRSGDDFRLAAPALEARRALEVSGLDRHFRVFDTVEDALAAGE